ncbi:hypothetical protein UFOVP1290_95 [uncultured Caudovirales phage]|uniref:Uncharacterized protein n=1 Tax=uncultured Caudovirales phage TaxID=2100421 RepID=A0A6J5RWE7_9CAUD|nr:hypothetical protein UFOVP1290_95 [uncultured Caudovirales phage]
MGVDYCSCNKCGIGFRNDSDYCRWCECGNRFCSMKCAKLKNYQEDEDEDDEDDEYSNRIDKDLDITCCICRNEIYNDYILFQALMAEYNLTRDQVIEIWKKQNNKGKK